MKNRRALRSLCCAGFVLPGVLALGGLVAHAASVTYTYDKAGRLKSAAYSDTSSVSYTLDPAGNRKSVTTSGPDSQAPNVPTGLGGSSPSCSQVNLSWNATTDNPNPGGSGVASYKLFRGGSLLVTIPNTTYTDTGLTGGTTYQYSVAAVDLVGNTSAQSPQVPITTAAPPPPTVPTGLSASAPSTTQVVLTWNASSDPCGPGVSGYRVYRGSSSGSLSLLTSTGGSSYTDSTVSATTTYWYAVAAYDAFNVASAQSAAVSVTTPNAYITDSRTLNSAELPADTDDFYGYSNGTYANSPFGSVSSTTLTGGKTLAAFYDLYSIGGSGSDVVISGFTSDPGQGWLNYATALGVTKTGASANYYYSNGIASWGWGTFFGFGATGSGTVTISHR